MSSPKHRHLQAFCEDFAGLEENTSRYDLLVLVKRAGKAAGFSSKAIQLLDYYMAFTRDMDWEEGARPIVYQSLAKTSLDLGVSERQIQRLEQALFELGAITHNDSGNHRRYGQRCKETGRILYAYGVELTPLAALKPTLEAKLQEKQLRDKAWLETKREISYYRRQVRSLLEELDSSEEGLAAYEAVATPIRTYLSLEALRELLAKTKELHQSLLQQVKECAPDLLPMQEKESPGDDENVVHKDSSTQKQSDKSERRDKPRCFQEGASGSTQITQANRKAESLSKEDLVLRTGLQHITLKQALNAAGERFKEHIPMEPRPMNWNDVVEAAYRLKPHLEIGQQSWGEGCSVFGRNGAAICLLLTDRATQREKDPVRKPAAYFASMVRRSRSGELFLHKSIMAILKREEGAQLPVERTASGH